MGGGYESEKAETKIENEKRENESKFLGERQGVSR